MAGREYFFLISKKSDSSSTEFKRSPKLKITIKSKTCFTKRELQSLALELGQAVICSLVPESKSLLGCVKNYPFNICLPVKSNKTVKLEVLKETIDALRQGSFLKIGSSQSSKSHIILPIRLSLTSFGLAVLCFRLKKIPNSAHTFLRHGRRLHLLPLQLIPSAQCYKDHQSVAKEIIGRASNLRRDLNHGVLLHPEQGEAFPMNVSITLEKSAVDLLKSSVFKEIRVSEDENRQASCFGKIRNIPQLLVFLAQIFPYLENKTLKLSITRD